MLMICTFNKGTMSKQSFYNMFLPMPISKRFLKPILNIESFWKILHILLQVPDASSVDWQQECLKGRSKCEWRWFYNLGQLFSEHPSMIIQKYAHIYSTNADIMPLHQTNNQGTNNSYINIIFYLLRNAYIMSMHHTNNLCTKMSVTSVKGCITPPPLNF